MKKIATFEFIMIAVYQDHFEMDFPVEFFRFILLEMT